jgi:hypothetical protein
VTESQPFPSDIEEFVQSAVRLPHDRLRKIDRQWDKLILERGVVRDLIQSNTEIRLQLGRLREYIIIAARMAEAAGEAGSGTTALLPEEVAEAVLPAARAVFLRRMLELSSIPERAAAYAALTAPFLDILPERT